MGYRIISADSHLDLIWVPHDAFTSRAPAEWKDKVPYVESRPRGQLLDGRRPHHDSGRLVWARS